MIKAVAVYNKINRLRRAIRAEGNPTVQSAWDDLEPHVSRLTQRRSGNLLMAKSPLHVQSFSDNSCLESAANGKDRKTPPDRGQHGHGEICPVFGDMRRNR
jgi:hypothetical protein